MYDFISGDVTEVSPVHAVLHTHGIGYYINITLETYSHIGSNRFETLYIYQHLREDTNALYGFYTREERAFFKLLISVSGIGPSSALKALASVPWNGIARLIANGDVDGFKKIKGVGPKTANQIIVELKDKVNLEPEEATSAPINAMVIDDATKALVALGFPKAKAGSACKSIFHKDPSIPVEALIKSAIKMM